MKFTFLFISFLSFYSCTSHNFSSINSHVYTGKDISSYATLETNNKNKNSELKILHTGPWKLYESGNYSFNFSIPVLEGKGEGKYYLDNSKFHLYCLEWNDTSERILGLRQQPLEGQSNFRDLGGYKTTEGRYVKWGIIFRSGKCNLLTENDLAYLTSIPLNTIIDFRSEKERSSELDKVPSSIKKQIQIPFNLGNLNSINVSDIIKNADIIASQKYLIDANKVLVTEFQEEYKNFFSALMNKENLPLMFHCTSGKDRTGIASALFLSSLGVDRETIIKDYLLTNTCSGISPEKIKEKYGDTASAECLYYLYSAQREYIESAFSTIEKEYGSIDNYLTKQLNVDIDQMKRLYLY